MIEIIDVTSITCIDVVKFVKFTDRISAGHILARFLTSYKNTPAVVVGLPRGGVVVAHAIASDLALPLGILAVKKIPSPANSELAIGAVASDNVSFIDRDLVSRLNIPKEYVTQQIEKCTQLVHEKTRRYQKWIHPLEISGKTVLLVDDGVATGSTMEVAIRWCSLQKAVSVVVAIPVAPLDTVLHLRSKVHEVVVIEKPERFEAVGQFYHNFQEITDNDIIRLLRDQR